MAPKSAGTTFAKAGASTGLCSTGWSGIISITPTASTTIVTSEEVAIESVEMISFSAVPDFAPTMSRAVIAQGIFMLMRLPVIKAR